MCNNIFIIFFLYFQGREGSHNKNIVKMTEKADLDLNQTQRY